MRNVTFLVLLIVILGLKQTKTFCVGKSLTALTALDQRFRAFESLGEIQPQSCCNTAEHKTEASGAPRHRKADCKFY